MIISPSDFLDRPYKIPNQEESRDLVSFLEEKEEDILRNLLGNELYDLFIAAIDPDASGEPDQIYTDLLGEEPVSYTYNDVQYVWKGLVDLLKPAIFSQWQPEGTFKFTNVGHVVNNAPQQSKVIEDQYIFEVLSWNKFVGKVGITPQCYYNCENTFYGFMKANEESYPEWVFKSPQFKNRWDL